MSYLFNPKLFIDQFQYLISRKLNPILLSNISGFISALGSQGLILVVNNVFLTKDAGLLFFSQSILLQPAIVISNSASLILLNKLRFAASKHDFYKIVGKFLFSLFIFSTLSSVFVFTVSPLVSKYFPSSWSNLSTIVRLLIPLYASSLIVSPLSVVMEYTNNFNLDVLGQFALNSFKMLPFLIIPFLSLSFEQEVSYYAWSCFLGYLVYLLIMFKALNSSAITKV